MKVLIDFPDGTKLASVTYICDEGSHTSRGPLTVSNFIITPNEMKDGAEIKVKLHEPGNVSTGV